MSGAGCRGGSYAAVVSGQPSVGPDVDPPLLREVFPQATRAVVEVLTDLGEQGLAARLLDQRFHGRCACKPDCRFVLTAPSGSGMPLWLMLESDDEVVAEATVDASGTFLTSLYIADCAAVGVPPDWLDAVVAASRSGESPHS